MHQELTTGKTSIDLAWTDITWLLYAEHVSWAYYVQSGSQPDCDNDAAETCAVIRQSASTPGIWNPLPLFGDVQPITSCTTSSRSATSSTPPARARCPR